MTTKDKVWESYKSGIEPVRKTHSPQHLKKPAHTTHPAAVALRLPLRASAVEPDLGIALERTREKRLRHGDVEIDSRLDLHGMTQAEAFDALAHFMQRNAMSKNRNLLIITGKGSGGKGVLRRNLQAWLKQLPESGRLLALRSAAPRHGGEGAFYVVLRNKSKT